jgi:preprotein translocase subunit SecD
LAQSIAVQITQATAQLDVRTGEPIVIFQMSPASARAFAELTTKNVGRKAAISVDGRVVSAPIIRAPILGGKVEIAGNLTVEEAKRIAAGLTAGTSMLKIEIVPEGGNSK